MHLNQGGLVAILRVIVLVAQVMSNKALRTNNSFLTTAKDLLL
jgi:hypothetical protein